MNSINVSSTNLTNYIISEVGARYNAAYTRVLRYYVDVRHLVLNLHKEVSAPELFILESKLAALVASWDDKYAEHVARERLAASKDEADVLTVEANERLDSLSRILVHTLRVNDAIDWESLKDKTPPPALVPYRRRTFPHPSPHLQIVEKPTYTPPVTGMLDQLLGRRSRKMEAAEAAHAEAVRLWSEADAARREAHAIAMDSWEARRGQHEASEDTAQATHESEQRAARAAFLATQEERNAKVDALRDAVATREPEAVIEHATMVLDASDYEGLFEKSFVVQYHRDDKLLKVAFDLPSPDVLPTLKSVRFVKATGELKEIHISDRDRKANFDAVAYQVALRSLHELFEADQHQNLERILFNGYVNFIDRGTGNEARACILSVLVDRSNFTAIDLARVEPKTCFKSLKGVSAASLASLAAVPPVMEMDREDRRFIEAREVVPSIDAGTNLAAMSWEDFEHLVRELFEKEFASRGGEVRITRASSDGGVDAVAFDPDPITGGKIVIQAKRYTKTVGVSAVRDLYGTLMNEGAAKGILVTTADYGPDAYQFANGKPITLMNGNNLLYLLERHGYQARIDVMEARLIANEA